MSLSDQTPKLLSIVRSTLGLFGSVQNLILVCCGLFIVVKVFPPSLRWVTHHVLPNRLRNQISDSYDSAQRRIDRIDNFSTTIPPYPSSALQILHTNPKAVVDIVAVHGLGANSDYAWVWNPKNNPPGKEGYPDKPVNWLVDFLPEKIPPYRVMTFNYNSTWIFDAPQQRLSTISDELLTRLRDERGEKANRPLIFIGHSFGGNIIEQAIVSASRQDSLYADIARSTVGVIFLGTPHRGSSAASWGALIASNARVFGVVTEPSILKDLEKQSGTLTDRLHEFSSWLFSNSVHVMCCFEKRLTDYSPRIGFFGKFVSQWTKVHVVDEPSACIDGHIKAGLDTDHFKINKFYGLQDPSFTLVYPEIARMTIAADGMLKRRLNPQDIPTDDMATPEELRKCLQKMLLTDPRDDLARIERQKEERVPDTCEWLLKREEFSAWGAANDSQLLHLVGSPGIGKTMISIFLVGQLKRKVKITHNTIFAHFFCDNKDKNRNTPTAILRSIIRQLLLQRHTLFQHIKSEFEEQKSHLFENFDSLWRVLESILRDDDAGEVFVLVDALDECEYSLRRDLLTSIKRLFALQSTKSTRKFKFLITSRPEIDIKHALNDVCISLCLDSSKINSDLSKYINTKVEELSKKQKYTTHTTEMVRKVLEARTGATFLWVSLMVAELEDPETDQDQVEEKLKSLPIKLNDTYDRILRQVNKDKRPKAQFLLQLMVAARRPLQKYEVATAFAMYKNGSIPQKEDLDKFTEIHISCRSLVYLDGADDTVNFVHQSVKDFLLDTSTQWYHTSLDSANFHMFKVCLEYLTTKDPTCVDRMMYQTWDIKGSYQAHLLLQYAFDEWKEHALAGCPALLKSFESIRNRLYKAPILGNELLLRTAREGQREVVELLLDTSTIDADSKDTGGRTPLSWAAWNGHEAVVKLLLGINTVDADSKDTKGRTPLSWASQNGHEAVVKLLLDTGTVDADSKDRYGKTPLSWATYNGYTAMIKLLLNTRTVDADSKDIGGQTPPLWAAWNGHEAVVKLLLDTGTVDADSKDMDGQTPLSWASRNGQEAVVKLLLDTGTVDADSKDRYGKTPLSRAAQNDHKAMAKLLLNFSTVDANSKDIHSQTLQLWAAGNGHEAVAKLLLDTGRVDADSKDNDRETPLLWAAKNGHEVMVKLLLDTGTVDADLKDIKGQTPLSWAARNGHKAVVKLLLDTSTVDADLKDIKGRTPLSWAAQNGHEAVFKLLFNTGTVNADSKDIYSQTPLSWASQNGYEAMVELLLDTGTVDADSKDIEGQTPLSWAARNGHKAVVKFLLDIGTVDANSKDMYNRMPLSWAARSGHEAVVKLLLDTGTVDANSKDIRGRTPLSFAAGKGHEAIVRLLLDTGTVDAELKDTDGWTPLSWAAENGHKAIEHLLLQQRAILV